MDGTWPSAEIQWIKSAIYIHAMINLWVIRFPSTRIMLNNGRDGVVTILRGISWPPVELILWSVHFNNIAALNGHSGFDVKPLVHQGRVLKYYRYWIHLDQVDRRLD